MTSNPSHIAIIMDGNGRWANRRGLPRTAGHRAGVEALRRIVRHASDLGIRYLTVYAFSTENWRRPRHEVSFLIGLLREYFQTRVEEMHRNGVVIRVIGDLSEFPPDIAELAAAAETKTKDNKGLCLIIAMNYGARYEILRVTRVLAAKMKSGELSPEQIDEEVFARELYTAGVPDPELIIRTSGEFRLSNFLLWQAAYAEIVIMDECWPEFNAASFDKALAVYQARERRFGDIQRSE
jgi:undecaprenyl diphosphate synthase